MVDQFFLILISGWNNFDRDRKLLSCLCKFGSITANKEK